MVLTKMQLQLLLLSACLYILEHDAFNKVKRFVKFNVVWGPQKSHLRLNMDILISIAIHTQLFESQSSPWTKFQLGKMP